MVKAKKFAEDTYTKSVLVAFATFMFINLLVYKTEIDIQMFLLALGTILLAVAILRNFFSDRTTTSHFLVGFLAYASYIGITFILISDFRFVFMDELLSGTIFGGISALAHGLLIKK